MARPKGSKNKKEKMSPELKKISRMLTEAKKHVMDVKEGKPKVLKENHGTTERQ